MFELTPENLDKISEGTEQLDEIIEFLSTEVGVILAAEYARRATTGQISMNEVVMGLNKLQTSTQMLKSFKELITHLIEQARKNFE